MFSAWSVVLLGLLLPTGGIARDDKEKPVAPRYVQIEMAVFRGDPFGSREEGTVKTVANPTLVTIDKHSVEFLVGGESVLFPQTGPGAPVQFRAYGLRMRVTPHLQADGRILLDFCIERSKPVPMNMEKSQVISFDSRQIFMRRLVKQEETFKMMGGEDDPGMYVWIQAKVRETDSSR
jgi:hypothetical protein